MLVKLLVLFIYVMICWYGVAVIMLVTSFRRVCAGHPLVHNVVSARDTGSHPPSPPLNTVTIYTGKSAVPGRSAYRPCRL